jgi:hypothetical protein
MRASNTGALMKTKTKNAPVSFDGTTLAGETGER